MTRINNFILCKRLLSKALICTFIMLLIRAETHTQESIFINEIMASNGQTLSDEDGDFSDWIELYNSGSQSVNLLGYGLSDNTDNQYKWVFPGTVLLPGEYLVVWASGKDKKVPGEPLHTNFSISAGGEPIALTNNSGDRLDLIPAVAIPRDVSYGRIPDGGASLKFFAIPSPGLPNNTEGYEGVLSTPTIIEERQADGSYLIQMSHEDNQVEIKYTTNGRDPSLHGLSYNQPFDVYVEIRDSLMRIPTLPIELADSPFAWKEPAEVAYPSGLTVQAIATRPNFLTSKPTYKTILEDNMDIPIVSITADSDVLFGDELGIYVPGAIYNELGFNWETGNGAPNANYFLSGPEAERTIHVDFIYPGGKNHQQTLGTRIHGSGSRAMPQKSLRFYARSGLGDNSINFDVFQNGKTGYRRLTLRNSGQDFAFEPTMMRDVIAQKIMSHFQAETQASQEVVVFINGEFWGIQNLRERTDRHHLEQKYDIEPNMLDMLEFDAVIIEGDYLHYDQLKTFISNNDLSEDTILSEVETYMDIENYIDYNIAHIFSANFDWPGNNVSYWRYRTREYEPDAPYGKDGRWRWIIKDLDFGFGLWDRPGYHLDLFTHATTVEGDNWPNPPWSTFVFRNLLKNELFRNRFINRFCDQLNTGLLPDRMIDMIEDHAAKIAPFMELHTQRWGHPDHIGKWRENVEVLNTFAQKRPDVVRDQMVDFFEFDAAVGLELDVSGSTHGFIRINTVDIQPSTAGVEDQPYPWMGYYFKEVPIELEALPRPGYEFSHWEGVTQSSTNPLTIHLKESENKVKAVFRRIDNQIQVPIYHWHFNQLPSGHLSRLVPDISIHQHAGIVYRGSGDGYMDNVNEGTGINAIAPYEPGAALRVRNPSRDRELIFTLPTIKYKDLKFSYATQRTNNGATAQRLYYKTTQQDEWIPIGDARFIDLEWQLVEIDLSDIPKVDNNANFALKIEFLGPGASNSSGNNRFDNVTLTGRLIDEMPEGTRTLSGFKLFPNPIEESFTLDLELTQTTKIDIHLYTIDGKSIKGLFNGIAERGSYRFIDDLSSLPSGSYLILISTDGDNQPISIVKQ